MNAAALSRRLTCPRPRTVLAASLAFVAVQTSYQLVGAAVARQGPLDETAHLLTTLMIFWAVRRSRLDRLLIPALVASVAIDIDHVPRQLGYDWLTAGTSRPYTHSLATIAVGLMAALMWRTRRDLFLGFALGIASHLWRDLAEPAGTGVALFWPFAKTKATIPSAVYLIGMAGLALTALYRSWRSSRWESAESDASAAPRRLPSRMRRPTRRDGLDSKPVSERLMDLPARPIDHAQPDDHRHGDAA